MGDKSQDLTLITVPFESLKRVSRDRKHLLESVKQIIDSLTALSKDPHDKGKIDRSKLLHQALALQGQALEISIKEQEALKACAQRLKHVALVWNAPSEIESRPPEWNAERFNRLLADYLLRARHSKTASEIIREHKIEELVDAKIFEEGKPILESLRQQNCGPALLWCQQNSAKLKKTRSKLEFKLRCQEYIEMVRRGDKLGAVLYGRKFLSPFSKLYMDEFKRVIVSTVVINEPEWSEFEELFGQKRWSDLQQCFFENLFQLHNMSSVSLLEASLQAGLIVLKPPNNFPEVQSGHDPFSQQVYKDLAKDLPNAGHSSMRLICPLSKKVIDHVHRGYLMPNKQVLSSELVDEMKKPTDDGFEFKHPISGEVYSSDQWLIVKPV